MKKILCSILVMSAVIVSAASCEKETGKESGAAAAFRTNITLDKHFNAKGTLNLRNWEKTDRVAIINTRSNAQSDASPISPGTATSLFTFSMNNTVAGDKMVAYFPQNADIAFNNGMLKTKIESKQTGTFEPVFIGKTEYPAKNSVVNVSLSPYYTILYGYVSRGDYAITKAVLKGNSSEKISGDATINATDFSIQATETSITVEFATPLDCRLTAQSFPVVIAPVTFTKGYTITYTTDAGNELVFKTEDEIAAEMGGRIDAKKDEEGATQLLFCGDNMIYLIDAEEALEKGYKNAIKWQWNAKTEASRMGMTENNMVRLDDCKPVDNGKKILATSSKSYAVLLDFATQKLLWYTTSAPNAHSAELLPGNRIAVACSEHDSGHCLQIYDISQPNKVLFSTPLEHGHGVVWNPANNRLYAGGNTTLKEFTLVDWETSSPKLNLEKEVSVYPHISGLHDLVLIDGNTLLMTGKYAAFYDIVKGTFTKLPHFNQSTSMKSINYNIETGECWYTDATNSGRDLTWSSNDMRYTDDVTTTGFKKNIMVGGTFNMYKVRVYKW